MPGQVMRIRHGWLPLVVIGALLAGACQVLGSFTGGQQPGPNPIPVVTEPPPRGDALTLATVEEITIQLLESFPVQVQVTVRGYLNDSCTAISRIVNERNGNAFQVTIFALREQGQVCAQAVYPFEEQTELDVASLPPGTYQVDVNGVRGQFELPAENLPVVERGALSGVVWHDLCAIAHDALGNPVQPTAGCLRLESGLFGANGVLEAGEPGLSGVRVDLGLGVCPAAGFANASTDGEGRFRFADLAPGTYCVSVDPAQGHNAALLLPGLWSSPSRAATTMFRTITLQPGQHTTGLDFGWDYQFMPEAPQLPTPTPTTTATARPQPCDWAQFVKDLTVPDGSLLAPGAGFTKTWRLKNIGSCTWTDSYSLVFASGDQMGAPNVVPLGSTVRPGETIDLSVKLTAPPREGRYRGYWQLRSAQGGLFGLGEQASRRFWVDIEVEQILRTLAYDFAVEYCNASWESADGELPCPGSQESESGFVQLLASPHLENRRENEPAVWVHPNHARGGWIRGTYPELKVREGDRFKAWVGCLNDREGCDVLFELGYLNANGRYRALGEWHERYEGKVTVIDLDLSSLEGEQVSFVLTMITENDRPRKADGFWFVPHISRVDTTSKFEQR